MPLSIRGVIRRPLGGSRRISGNTTHSLGTRGCSGSGTFGLAAEASKERRRQIRRRRRKRSLCRRATGRRAPNGRRLRVLRELLLVLARLALADRLTSRVVPGNVKHHQAPGSRQRGEEKEEDQDRGESVWP